MTTPRKRLSTAIKRAVRAAREDSAAQENLHSAFYEAYGFELNIDELLGDDVGVESLSYGNGTAPSLSDFDKAVEAFQSKNEED